MLDTLANSGAEIDDTPMILLAQESDAGDRRADRAGDRAKARSRSRPCSTPTMSRSQGTNPQQYLNAILRFRRRPHPAVPRSVHGRREPGDRGGDQRRQRLSADPHQRTLAAAVGPTRSGTQPIAATAAIPWTKPRFARSDSDKPACSPPSAGTWATEGSVVAKNIYVPLFIAGRRWGNFELAYVDAGYRPSRG